MDKIKNYILKVKPDQITGKMPTCKQLEVMMLINPFRAKHVKYADAAKLLGVTVNAVKERMKSLKKRCPQIYKAFREERFKDRTNKRPIKHEVGCVGCGCVIPEEQDMCFSCWRKENKKRNPEQYNKDSMFPANGPTRSTIGLDKEESADEWMERNGHKW